MTLKANSSLNGVDAPRVVTPALLARALAHEGKLPSRGALFEWIDTKKREGNLLPVTKGVYLNRQATPRPTIDEAAQYIRAGAVVSLQKVLGDAGISNNFTSVVTCLVPWEGKKVPRVGRVKTRHAEFHFRLTPLRIAYAGDSEDRLDSNYQYPRATPERALLDWLRLGLAPQSRMARPPLDMDLDLLDSARLDRLADAMDLGGPLDQYRHDVGRYHEDPDVQANADASGTWF